MTLHIVLPGFGGRNMVKTGCDKDCANRSPTCHATCEKYLAAWKERRERNEKLKKQGEITAYTIEEVRKTKRNGHHGLKKLRPKGGGK